jgi:hypothetical protein
VVNILSSSISYFPGFLWDVVLPETLRWILFLAVIWVPIVLAEYAWEKWITYVRAAWYTKVKKTVLEVKLPRETLKSPKAMELVLNAIHNTSDGNWYKMYWNGEFRPQYSLELVSIEGNVKFMIWTEDARKVGLMAALYSQYPGIEVVEREDYASKVQFDPKTMKVWAADMKFTKPDPYPIKTYIDYGLDKDPKEEFKVDPLTPALEWLGAVGPNQQVWIQFIVRAHKKDKKHHRLFAKEEDAWKKEGEKIVNDIMKRDPDTKATGEVDEEGGMVRPVLSEGEREIIAAIGRSVAKPAFDVGIRAIYLATKKESFDTPFGIGGIISTFKHFNSENLNGIVPNGETWVAQFGFPWQDYKNIRRNMFSKEVIDAYRKRGYFFAPYYSKPLVLNTEELATMYHFPGSVAGSPSIERIPSKRADAPSNLPI